MTRTIAQIDQEIEALEFEREALAAQQWIDRWSAYFPENIGEVLLGLLRDAAGVCEGEYNDGESEDFSLAPGVSIKVILSTDINGLKSSFEDLTDDPFGDDAFEGDE